MVLIRIYPLGHRAGFLFVAIDVIIEEKETRMPDKELLPTHYQMDHQAESGFSMVVPILAEIHNQQGSFVDRDFGPDTDDIQKYTKMLCHLLCPEGHDIRAEFASYEAFFFAYTATNILMPRSDYPTIYFGDYIKVLDEEGEEALIARIHQDTSDYLDANPSVDSLILEHLDTLDPSGQYNELTHTTAALVFLQAELGAERTYINEQIEGLERQF